jgi:ferritin-like metal-binding protein YciE
MEALKKLLQDEIEDIYDAEHQLIKALPKLIERSSSPELQQALKQHLTVTQNQIKRLEQVFETLGEKAKRKPCKGMAGIVSEGSEMLEEDLEESTRDVAIISAAQKVEHYEIASYGTVRTLAQTLGNNEVAELLEETLDEEKEADERLTQIAESSVNSEAASEANQTKTGKSASRSKTRNTRRSRGRTKAGR